MDGDTYFFICVSTCIWRWDCIKSDGMELGSNRKEEGDARWSWRCVVLQLCVHRFFSGSVCRTQTQHNHATHNVQHQHASGQTRHNVFQLEFECFVYDQMTIGAHTATLQYNLITTNTSTIGNHDSHNYVKLFVVYFSNNWKKEISMRKKIIINNNSDLWNSLRNNWHIIHLYTQCAPKVIWP